MDVKNLVQGLLGELQKVTKSDAVVGTVRDAGRAKVMPLSKVVIAFGAGTAGVGGKTSRNGDNRDALADGSGAGGALVVEPRAFVVVGEDGIPHLLALKNGKTAVMRRGIEILPEQHEHKRLGQKDVTPLADVRVEAKKTKG